jgi:ESS family glutamate:Na+ symporter
MTTGMNFWDFEVWSFIVEFAVLLAGMMVANMLRRLIKPLRRSLIPSSVIGGFLVLGVSATLRSFDIYIFQVFTLEILTYHGLGLGFVALALKTEERKKSKKANTDVFNTGVTVVSTYLLHGVVGLAITLGLSYVIGNWAAGGMLLPMGYGQGPGQAYNWGNIYQNATDYPPFHGGISFGLGIAAMGFIASGLGGVIYLNVMKAKGRIKQSILDPESAVEETVEYITKKDEIALTESLDKMTVQIGLVFLTYIGAFVLMYVVSLGLDGLGGMFSGTVKPIIWGFNFLIGTLCAIMLKAVLGYCRKRKIVNREYRNNFMLNRIAGFMFDLMVVASITAIDLSAFGERSFWVPLALLCVVGAVATYYLVKVVSVKIFPEYTDESFLALYGLLTGTVSTGIILLREADPSFETPAAKNLVYQQLWAIVFGFPMLLLMGIAPQSTRMSWLVLAALVILLVAMIVLLFRSYIFKKKKHAAT